jgi:hypothetical protein
MKTKEITKNRHAEREFDVAMMDCKAEFGSVLCIEDILDADYEINFEEDE